MCEAVRGRGCQAGALRARGCRSLSHTLCESTRSRRLLPQVITPRLDPCLRGRVALARPPAARGRPPRSKQNPAFPEARGALPAAPCALLPALTPQSPSLLRLQPPCLLLRYTWRRLPRAASGALHWRFPLPGMLFPDTRRAPPFRSLRIFSPNSPLCEASLTAPLARPSLLSLLALTSSQFRRWRIFPLCRVHFVFPRRAAHPTGTGRCVRHCCPQPGTEAPAEFLPNA